MDRRLALNDRQYLKAPCLTIFYTRNRKEKFMAKLDRRPQHERDAIRAIMLHLNIKYVAATKEYERRLAEQAQNRK